MSEKGASELDLLSFSRPFAVKAVYVRPSMASWGEISWKNRPGGGGRGVKKRLGHSTSRYTASMHASSLSISPSSTILVPSPNRTPLLCALAAFSNTTSAFLSRSSTSHPSFTRNSAYGWPASLCFSCASTVSSNDAPLPTSSQSPSPLPSRNAASGLAVRYRWIYPSTCPAFSAASFSASSSADPVASLSICSRSHAENEPKSSSSSVTVARTWCAARLRAETVSERRISCGGERPVSSRAWWNSARPRRRLRIREMRSRAGRRFWWVRDRRAVRDVVTTLSQRLWPCVSR